METLYRLIVLGLIAVGYTETTTASFVISHYGSIDPVSEGFAVNTCCGASTVGPLYDDLGEAAWSIVGNDVSSQVLYYSGPLSLSQQADIANNGFSLSSKVRVIGGAVYDQANPFVISEAQIDMGTKRFDISWALDGNGDTVVVLPTSFGFTYGLVMAYGPSFTLTGQGSSYHSYQLDYNPLTQSGNLSIDGIERISGYTGSTEFLENAGLRWGTSRADFGQVNFASVTLVSPRVVPIPTAFWLFLSAITGLGSINLIKKLT